MTNSQIIHEAAKAHGFTDEQLQQLLTAYNGDLPFHTLPEWGKRGFSVKSGEKAIFTADLWKYTDKPSKATREAAQEAGEDAPETSGHYYKKLSYLFSFSQVEKAAPSPDLQTLLDRFQNVPGLMVKVNGAQTAAPVVWLSGDVDAHADTIKAIGGHWSNKKQAYFFKPTHKTADDNKPADETPAEPQQPAPAEPKTAAALDPFGPRSSFNRCTVYAIRRDKGQNGPTVQELDGYTDGIYSYYAETHDGKCKTWFAIVPAYGLSVAQGSTRKEAQDKTHETAARIASSLAAAKTDERLQKYAAMLSSFQHNADQGVIPQF